MVRTKKAWAKYYHVWQVLVLPPGLDERDDDGHDGDEENADGVVDVSVCGPQGDRTGLKDVEGVKNLHKQQLKDIRQNY